MNRTYALAFYLMALVVLQGCTAATPVEQQSVMKKVEPVPELTLNLSENNCTCIADEAPDYTFLERGFKALVEGDHIEAVQYFQRYQRLETSAEADWEAAIAIAYISTLPKSPFYDPNEARKAYRKLKKNYSTDMRVHGQSLLMRDSLEAFIVMQRHVNDLQVTNATLKEDLRKREEALKRLRELALGQPATQP